MVDNKDRWHRLKLNYSFPNVLGNQEQYSARSKTNRNKTGRNKTDWKNFVIHKLIRATLICLITITLPWNAGASEILNAGADGVAIDGFDTVAYFTANKPVKGLEKFSRSYKGHQWRFASAANRDAFTAAPERYAPQYNGFCAIAVSEGAAAEVDFINGWTIQQGRLYMNWSASVKATFLNELDERIAASRRLWPDLQVDMKYGIRQIARHKDFPDLGIVHPQHEPSLSPIYSVK